MIDERRDRKRVVLAALIPVVTFLGLAAIRVARHANPDFDEKIFLDVGRHILDTGLPIRTYASPTPSLFFDHTPLYVYVVALLTAIGEPTVLIIRTTTLVFGVLTVLMVFRVGLVVRGLGSALVGSMLVALNPFFVTYAWFIRMEVPLCFFLVLALYLMIKERWLLAGLAIATAVMLKEIALAFWLVAVIYVLIRRGRRAAAVVAVPTLVAFFAWLAYAASIGFDQLRTLMGRWVGSAAGMAISDPRLHVGPLRWTGKVIGTVIGPLLVFASGAGLALAAVSRKPVPTIVVVPLAYVVIAVVASYLIRLKEPRFIIAVIPMLALVIALWIDWGSVWADVRGRGTSHPIGKLRRWLKDAPEG